MELNFISRHTVTMRQSLLQLVRCIHLSSRPCFTGNLESQCRHSTSPMYNNVSHHPVVRPDNGLSRKPCPFSHHFVVRQLNNFPAWLASTYMKHPKTCLELGSRQSEHMLVRDSRLRDSGIRQYMCITHTHISPLKTSSCVTLRPLVCVTPHHFFSMKRKDYMFPELKPEDLEEMYVRGSGPGGQAVNQTSNCVVLKHKPTGIVVKCHETRSLEENKKLARRKLEEKLDLHLHGDKSFLSQAEEESRQNRQEKKRRAIKRLALKRAFKEQDGSE